MCQKCELNISRDEAFYVKAVVNERMTAEQALGLLRQRYREIYNLKEFETLLFGMEKHLYGR